MASRAVVPRNFRLIEELERGEKGQITEGLSLGLADYGDEDMSHWNAAIHGPPYSAHENRLYFLKIYCDADYPDKPPVIHFITKINLPCVDQKNGKVNNFGVPCLERWNRDTTMEKILSELKWFMGTKENRKLPQPPEGSSYE